MKQSELNMVALMYHQLGWAFTPKTGAVQVRLDRQLTAEALVEKGPPLQTRKLSIWQD